MDHSFQAASLSELKKELTQYEPKKLIELSLRLAKYKKENKELLTYLLFEEENEAGYVTKVKGQIEVLFKEMYKGHLFQTYKALRKILRVANKHIKYSNRKETEVELLLFYCQQLKKSGIRVQSSNAIAKLLEKQIKKIQKAIGSLHEDLQYDYQQELDKLT